MMETRIKYCLKIIGSLVAIGTGIILIWQFFQPEYALEADVLTTKALFPHEVAKKFKELSLLPLEKIKKREDIKSLESVPFEVIQQAHPVFQEFFTKQMDVILDHSFLGLPSGITVATIRNSCKKTLSNVELTNKIGSKRYAQIDRGSGEPEI